MFLKLVYVSSLQIIDVLHPGRANVSKVRFWFLLLSSFLTIS